MKQLPLPDLQLEATNGLQQMVMRGVLKDTRDKLSVSKMENHAPLVAPPYEAVTPTRFAVDPVWKTLLRCAVDKGASALINVGAMLAGLELSGAAAFLLELLFKKEHPLRAGVFFQCYEDDNNGEWMLRDVDGRQWPLKHAPIRERDAFVVFDERNCRGTDMRLRQNASAVLTLGPMMVKDKLMQAAGTSFGQEYGPVPLSL
jgi:hypothetical protein